MSGWIDRATQAAIDATREDVAALHAELVRYELVVWTGGNVSGRVPGTDLFVIKPSGVGYDDLTPRTRSSADSTAPCSRAPRAASAARRATPPRTRTSTATCRTSGSGAHALDLRDGLGCAGRGDPLRDHGHGRRVRRRDPRRAVRDHRRRVDRRGHRRDADRSPQPRRADAEPRGLHDRQGRPRRGQGRRHDRRRRAHRAHHPPARRAHPHPSAEHRRSVRPVPECLRATRSVAPGRRLGHPDIARPAVSNNGELS